MLESIWVQIQEMRWSDYLDIILVAFLIYKLLPMFRSTGTARIAWVAGVIIVMSWLTDALKLHTLSYLFSQVLTVGLLALVVLFQPELRRMLDHLSNVKLKSLIGTHKPQQEAVLMIAQTVHACEVMSRERIGALIVFARDNRLDEYFKTGTMIEGKVSEQLIRNIFFPKASLHDGAMIIRDGLITAAGCVLPLSDTNRLSLDLGTRHRAAVGMSEVSDAVVVVVSEETGAISVAVGGVLKRHLAPQTLERLLRNELCPDEDSQPATIADRAIKLYQKFQKKDKGGEENEK
ncbi:MAG: diadenylate cyclase CdaA [Oscillospiraceae bacterium]|nr:diadenylate cyclase CdaA [Oscillospiraceae bacterium]